MGESASGHVLADRGRAPALFDFHALPRPPFEVHGIFIFQYLALNIRSVKLAHAQPMDKAGVSGWGDSPTAASIAKQRTGRRA